MKFKFDHDLHIHSCLSSCSKDPEQTGARILQYAKDNGLRTVCLTDHYWDSAVEGASGWYAPQNFEHIAEALPLPQADGIRFLFGCETEMRKDLTLGIPSERFDDFDFVIIPTTHLHMRGFTITEEDAESNEMIARRWVERLDALLSMDLPFHKIGIAHPVCPLICRRGRENYLASLELIDESALVRIFTRAAALGVGIELNQSDMIFSDEEADIVLRPFRIAKACGCKFYLGSDAHHPASFEKTREIFERAIDLLELEESDKFKI